MSWLRKEIEKIVSESTSKSFTLGTVIKLNKSTVNVEPTNGDPVLFNVKLSLNTSIQGWAVKPKLNSEVLVGHINGNEKNCFVAMFSEVDSVMINGDGNGGLIITPELVAQINKNTAAIAAIQSAFETWVATPNDGGAALRTLVCGIVAGPALPGSFPKMALADLSKVENEKIKHG